MRAWVEMLPLCVVRWLAFRYCERVTMDGRRWVVGRHNENLVVFRDYSDKKGRP